MAPPQLDRLHTAITRTTDTWEALSELSASRVQAIEQHTQALQEQGRLQRDPDASHSAALLAVLREMAGKLQAAEAELQLERSRQAWVDSWAHRHKLRVSAALGPLHLGCLAAAYWCHCVSKRAVAGVWSGMCQHLHGPHAWLPALLVPSAWWWCVMMMTVTTMHISMFMIPWHAAC
jgi:hypothetical protein